MKTIIKLSLFLLVSELSIMAMAGMTFSETCAWFQRHIALREEAIERNTAPHIPLSLLKESLEEIKKDYYNFLKNHSKL